MSAQVEALSAKAKQDALKTVNAFTSETEQLMSTSSEALGAKINATVTTMTNTVAKHFENTSVFEDYDTPKMFDNETKTNRGSGEKAFIHSQMPLSETRTSAFERDTADISNRLQEKIQTDLHEENEHGTTSSTVTINNNSSRFSDDFFHLIEKDESKILGFDLFAPLGFKAPGATLRNAFRNLKVAKNAIVHADIAYRIVRSIQNISQHWQSNAFILDPMEAPSHQRPSGEVGGNTFKRSTAATKKVSTIEKVAKFFGDPVHVAAMKLGLALFVVIMLWSVYYTML